MPQQMSPWRSPADIVYDGEGTKSWRTSQQLPKAGVIRYIALITASSKGRQWQRALKLFAEMSKQWLQADVITYSATISACSKGG